MSPSIIEHFSILKDPRIDRHKKHELIDIIVLCISAVVSGAEGWSDIVEFGHNKLDWLRKFVPLENGIPVDDTIARVISSLSVKGFQECFQSWVSAVSEATEGECIAIDGKTLRRSFDRRSNKKALHMISAWATNNNLVLGQVKTEEKSNEITAIPELLKVLELKGCIVTIDAMGCQEAIAEQIIEGQGDYTLAVKANQGKLYDSLIDFFQVARAHHFKNVPVEYQETVDKAHGRVEIRRYWISNCLDSVYKPERWKKLCAIGLVESERHEKGKTTYDKRYYILSHYHIALFAQAVRSHWCIENKLHWTLDMTFREDESRIRRGNASHNFGVIRHLALNLLKMEKSKLSIKKKRLRAALNDQFRANVLCGV